MRTELERLRNNCERRIEEMKRYNVGSAEYVRLSRLAVNWCMHYNAAKLQEKR